MAHLRPRLVPIAGIVFSWRHAGGLSVQHRRCLQNGKQRVQIRQACVPIWTAGGAHRQCACVADDVLSSMLNFLYGRYLMHRRR